VRNGHPRKRSAPDRQDEIRTFEARLVAIADEQEALKGRSIDASDLRAALPTSSTFDSASAQTALPPLARKRSIAVDLDASASV
jgi:hypothetical protein